MGRLERQIPGLTAVCFKTKKGHFISDEVRLIYSGVTRRESAVALLLDNQAGKCVERGEPYNGLLMVMVIVMNLYSTFPIHMRILQVINRWTSAYTCTGAAGSRYLFISDLTQPMNEWNEAWLQHWDLHTVLFVTCVWLLLCPTALWTLKGCETGSTVYCPYLRRLESLTICRCHYKDSTFSWVV